MVVLSRTAPPLASLPGLRLVILLVSPLVSPRMVHKPWAAHKPLAPHRPAVRTIGLVAASLMLLQAAQALA